MLVLAIRGIMPGYLALNLEKGARYEYSDNTAMRTDHARH